MAAPQVHLVIPGLCGPLPEPPRPTADTAACFRALGRGRQLQHPAHGLAALLAGFFSLDTAAAFPSAALSLSACLGEEGGAPMLSSSRREALGEALRRNEYFMHADPVHLRAELDHAVLVGSQMLDLGEQEASALVEALRAHFADDGIEVFACSASRWFVSTRRPQRLTTVPLDDAIGRNVNFILPRGEDARRWQSFLNESQMLLFASEQNRQREQLGQYPVNSVWLHGGGCLPAAAPVGANAPFVIDRVLADAPLLRGLAALRSIPCETLPEQVADHGSWTGEHTLVYLDALLPWLNESGSALWQQALSKYWQRWLAPLMRQANRGRLRLTVYPADGRQWFFSRFHACRLWKKTPACALIRTYRNDCSR